MTAPESAGPVSGRLLHTGLLSLAAFVVLVAGMKAANQILVPFLLALFIAVISAPPMFFLIRRGLPKGLALLAIMLAILGIGFGLAGLVGSSLDDFYGDLPKYEQRVRGQMSQLLLLAQGYGIEIDDASLLQQFDPGAAMQLTANVLRGLTGVLTNTFLILLTVVFMLLEASTVPAKLRAILGSPDAPLDRFDEFLDKMQNYVAIKTWVSLATGVLAAGGLALLGVDYPILWGVLAFLLNYVPTIGSIIAAVPPVLLALIQIGPGTALATAALFLTVNVVMGNGIEPRFMGRGLGLSTLVVFLSLVFWGWVLGPVGMLLSAPLTMTVKIALDSMPEARGIAILLGPAPEPPGPPETEEPAATLPGPTQPEEESDEQSG